MPKRTTISSAATAARNAEQELTRLRKAMRDAEDNLAGLHRMLKVPVPKGGNRTIKGSRSAPGLLQRAAEGSIGNAFAGNLLASAGLGKGSFYASSTQMAAEWDSLTSFADRIL